MDRADSFPRRTALEAVRRALDEDLPSGRDLTSETLFPGGHRSRGRFRAKSTGILAGRPLIELVYRSLDAEVRVRLEIEEGGHLDAGATVATVEGPTRALLTGERTILNFIQRLSGIATLTRRYVDAVAGTGCRIADTRKTTPGLRVLEKYAVRVGGGWNHRSDLSSAVMVKDNHLVGISEKWEAIRRLRSSLPHWVVVEVEVESLEQARRAVAAGVHVLLLDNMSPDSLALVVAELKDRATLEASGGITLQTVAEVARTGVHLVSVGALTHSAPALDLSFDLIEELA